MSGAKNSTPLIPLLHKWDGAPSQENRNGLFPLTTDNSIPGGWEPSLDQLDAKAIATPFARAEMMRLVLEKADAATQHREQVRFRLLLLGIVSGALEVLPADLEDASAFHELGRALVRVDPDARYFCKIVWPADKKLFGITYRSSLFSPHTRRTDAEWTMLSNAVVKRQAEALALLAEWRAALVRARLWDPKQKDCAWQKGVDDVLTSHVPPANASYLSTDCQLVGPVWLNLPTGNPQEPVKNEPVYLPSFSEKFAQRFSRALQFEPQEDANGAAIRFKDSGNREVARIEMTRPGPNQSALAAGMGRITLSDGPVSAPVVVQNWIPRLVSKLKSLESALPNDRQPVSAESRCLVLYPDVIRLLVGRNLWPAEGTRRAVTSQMWRTFFPLGSAAPDESAAGDGNVEVVSLGEGDARVNLYLADFYRDYPVNDLRALGASLWAAFVGDAEVDPRVKTLADLKLFQQSSDCPLEAGADQYAFVSGEPPEELRNRLATMQRFLKAYPNEIQPGLGRILARSARSFVAWASGRSDVQPLGRRAQKAQTIALPTGEKLLLWVDSLEN